MASSSSLLVLPSQVWNLVLSGLDYNRERVLRQIAVSSPSFSGFYTILKDPSVGLRHHSRKEALANYSLIFGPLLIISVFVVVLLNTKIDFFTAAIGTYSAALVQVPLVLWFGRRRITREIARGEGRVLGSSRGNKVLIQLLHLKLFFQYGLLIGVGFLGAALKTLSESPGGVLQAVGLLQNTIVDIILFLFALVTLIAPLYLLRRTQVNTVRLVENILFTNHFLLSYPEVEATINRKLAIEKVWGRLTSISNQMVLSKASGYVESFNWRDVVGIAAARREG